MSQSVLLLRVDANALIGAGHAMRCRALAQAWQKQGGAAVFLSQSLPQDLLEQLRNDGARVEEQTALPGSEEDGRLTAERARTLGASWLAVDSYAFGAVFFRQVRESGSRVLTFDDEGRMEHGVADLILRPWRISGEQRAGFLDGPRYALLRQEFIAQLERPREISGRARKILLTFGGADPENWTGRLLESLGSSNSPLFPEDEVTVLVGAANPFKERLSKQLTALRSRAHLELASREMARWLAWADLGLGSGGSTCWEMCALGLPALVLPWSSNQLPIAIGLAAAGAARNLGLTEAFDSGAFLDVLRAVADDTTARLAMSAAGRRLVDGRGAARVVAALQGGPAPSALAKSSPAAKTAGVRSVSL